MFIKTDNGNLINLQRVVKISLSKVREAKDGSEFSVITFHTMELTVMPTLTFSDEATAANYYERISSMLTDWLALDPEAAIHIEKNESLAENTETQNN